MQVAQMQLNRLPLAILFAADGTVAFQRLANFDTIVDQPETGVQCIMDDSGLYIGANTEIPYGVFVDYKQEGELLAWLKAQNLQSPF